VTSQEDVEVVRNAIAAFELTGVDGALEYFDPAIEWFAPPEWPDDRLYVGQDGLRTVASLWTENFEEFRLALETAVEAGDHVLALIIQRGRIRGSSRELEHRVAWDCQVRNGRVARVHPYFSWEEGLEAVGLAQFG
jgi:ketosteroid isomerase-like protein